MPSASRTSRPKPSTPLDLRRFLRHLLQESNQTVDDRIKALEELQLLMCHGAYADGLSAARRGDSAVTTNAPPPFPSLEVLRVELLRAGKGLPSGLAVLSILVDSLGDVRAAAMFISIVERNALEDFHREHLSDAQMKDLNPIIRNAAYTALHALLTIDDSEYARGYVDYHTQHIPPYWEQPELLEAYIQGLQRSRHVGVSVRRFNQPPSAQLPERPMRVINRAVLVVRYREPYLRWAASFVDKAPAQAARLSAAMSVYLVREDPTEEHETPPLEDFFEAIFTRELDAWWIDESQWPQQRDFATFKAWFEVTEDSMVTDLGTGPIRIEQL